MKKSFIIVATVLLLALCLAACGTQTQKYEAEGAFDSGTAASYIPKGYGIINSFRQQSIASGDFGRESYTEIKPNDYIDTLTTATSFFSLDTNTASYPNLRGMINNDAEIYPSAVRIEEMLNYFSYDYAEPTNGEPLAISSALFDAPYSPNTKLLTIGVSAKRLEVSEVKNNIVFLIDVSGSMFGDDRLGLIQSAFKLAASALGENDVISIVTYAGETRIALDGGYGYEKEKISAIIEDLTPRGSTNGESAINIAYQVAETHFIEGGNNRIVLATDGDFNVGASSVEELKKMISQKRESGVFFSVIGVGRDNLNATLMESLALNGNGNWGYMDSLFEARKLLVTELGGTFNVVAKDTKAKIEFNPDYVSEYRLIGYENKLLTQEEYEDNTKDAGEIGSGHTMTITYEIKLTQSGAELTEQTEEVFATATIAYKAPNATVESESLTITSDVNGNSIHSQLTSQDAFIASVVEFGLCLQGGEYKADSNAEILCDRLKSLELTDAYKLDFLNTVEKYIQNQKEGK